MKRTKLSVMKKRLVIVSIVFVAVAFSVNAQVVSKDSISMLKSQKETALLSAKLNEQKLKLASLENSLAAKTEAEQNARERAQKSADANSKVASDLSAEAQNRKLARKAKKAANTAKKDAKRLRKATSGLEGLQSDIESLKKKIADDETKLQAMQASQ
jgi:hypothetical protein